MKILEQFIEEFSLLKKLWFLQKQKVVEIFKNSYQKIKWLSLEYPICKKFDIFVTVSERIIHHSASFHKLFIQCAAYDAERFFRHGMQSRTYLKVSKNWNDFMKTFFLPKYKSIFKDLCLMIYQLHQLKPNT